MKRLVLFGAALLAVSLGISAQKAMKAPAGGKAISDELIGIFFEDISSSADGGLYAELVQNGSFESVTAGAQALLGSRFAQATRWERCLYGWTIP